jgi:hypothetical protein
MEQRHDYKRNKGYHKGTNRILMRNKNVETMEQDKKEQRLL